MEHGTDQSAVDAALAEWRQGDLLLSAAVPTARFASATLPLTDLAREQSEAEPEAALLFVAEEVAGLMIVSQTCDLVRACQDRPYAQVCPLVPADPNLIETTEKGERPRFLRVSGLSGEALVADLDQVFTVEKAVLADLAPAHRRGAGGDAEMRAVSRAIANKFGRTAFPDAFVDAASRMRREIVRKHDKSSALGVFLQAALEIRVIGRPDWIAPEEVEFLFVFERDGQIPADHDTHVDALISRFDKSEAYPAVGGRAVGLDRLSAATYRESDVLDLENLSRRSTTR